MVNLRKPKAAQLAIWDELKNCYPNYSDKLDQLKDLIMAPDNGFLLVDILSRLIDLRPFLRIGLPNYSEFQKHIETAEWMRSTIQKQYPSNDDNNAQLYFEAYMPIVTAHNQVLSEDLSEEQIESFINGNLWHGYKKKNHSLYSSLFFPYISDAILIEDASLQNALKFLNFIKAQIFIVLTDSAGVFDGNEKYINRYELSKALKKSISKKYYQHFNIAAKLDQLNTPEILNDVLKPETSKDVTDLENELSITVSKSSDSEQLAPEQIQESVKFIRSIFKAPTSPLYKGTKANNSTSEKSKYAKAVGLVIMGKDSNLTEYFQYSSTDVDDSSTLTKSVRFLHKTTSVPWGYFEYGDDLGEENQSAEIACPQIPPCEVQNPIAKITLGKRAINHINFYNQNLKSRIPASTIQLLMKKIASCAEDCANGKRYEYSSETRNTLLSLLMTLLIGRHLKNIYLKQTTHIPITSVVLAEDYRSIMLSFPNYDHRAYLADPELYMSTTVSQMRLQLDEDIHAILKNLVLSLLEDYAQDKKVLSLPVQSTINQYLKHLNTNNTLKELLSDVQRDYSFLVSGDAWLMSIFTATEQGLQSTQKHYASAPIRKVQRVFEIHCSRYLHIPVKQYLGYHRKPERIGSPFFVSAEAFSSITNLLRSTFHRLTIEPINFRTMPVDELCMRFNALSIYMDLFVAFSCAMRNVTDPMIELSDISLQGLCRVNDKNLFDGFNTRIVYVPPDLQQSLTGYYYIRRKLLTHFTKNKLLSQKNRGIASSNQLFYLTSTAANNIKIHAYTRVKARDTFSAKFQDFHTLISSEDSFTLELLKQLKTNLNRHYLRGRLYEKNVPGYFIDAYLGHWIKGTQPWGQTSIFNQQAYYKIMRQHIPTILEELGFRALMIGKH